MTFRSHVRTALLGIGLCVVLVVGLVGSVALRPATTGDQAMSGSPSGSNALASVDPSPSPLRSDQVVHRPTEVFGFLPYWSMADWTDSYLRYDLLTTIAFFGIGVRQNGTLITSGPGYDAFMSPRAATIVEHAHAAGVRVVITFESFGASKNKKFLAKAAYRATFVAAATAFVAAHGLDGLNLDVEGLDGADRPAFGLLVGDLAGSIHAANPAAEVSVATNANVSGARMAKIALDVGADRSFLMGYAYRVASSPAVGGIAPYTGVGTSLDLVRSLDLYEVNGIAPEEILLGLPYYGMTWATTTNEVHAPRQPTSAGFGTGPCVPAAHRGRGRAAARPDARLRRHRAGGPADLVRRDHGRRGSRRTTTTRRRSRRRSTWPWTAVSPGSGSGRWATTPGSQATGRRSRSRWASGRNTWRRHRRHRRRRRHRRASPARRRPDRSRAVEPGRVAQILGVPVAVPLGAVMPVKHGYEAGSARPCTTGMVLAG